MVLKYRSIVPLGAAALLSACTASLGEAERASAPPGEFAAALHAGYIALARAESDENDFVDADAFGTRAVAAAAGRPPAPEAVSARRLPPQAVPALSEARTRLVKALDGGARTSAAAAQAARAQLAFDCWIQEQEENFQTADIARCRSDFEAAIESVETKMLASAAPKAPPRAARGNFAGGVTPASFAGPAAGGQTARLPLATRFVVYFDFDRAGVTRAAEREILKVSAAARRTGAAMIRVVGHADRAGPPDHNMALSRARAQSVVAALQRLGLPDIGVATQALGEEMPAVPTADGAREPRNRRVEIELTH